MGNYKDTHGKSWFGNAIGYIFPPVGIAQNINNINEAGQMKKDNAAANLLFTNNAAAAAAAAADASTAQGQQAQAAASAQNVFKLLAIGLGVTALIVGAVFGIKYLKKRKAKA